MELNEYLSAQAVVLNTKTRIRISIGLKDKGGVK